MLHTFLKLHNTYYLPNRKSTLFQQENGIFIFFSDNSIGQKKSYFRRRQQFMIVIYNKLSDMSFSWKNVKWLSQCDS